MMQRFAVASLLAVIIICSSYTAFAEEGKACIPQEDLQECQESLTRVQKQFQNLQSTHQSTLGKLKESKDIENELKLMAQEKATIEKRLEQYIERSKAASEQETNSASKTDSAENENNMILKLKALEKELFDLRAKKPLLMDWVQHTIEEVKNQDYQGMASDSIESGSLYLTKGAMWLHATWNDSSQIVQLEQFDGVKVYATKAYAEHIEPLVVEPVLAHPTVKKHLPSLKKAIRRAKVNLYVKGSVALTRAKIARKAFVDKLKGSTNVHVVKHAQKIVDFGLGMALTPVALALVYLVLYVAYLIIGTACCCFCCGACSRKDKATANPPLRTKKANGTTTKGAAQRKASMKSKRKKND